MLVTWLIAPDRVLSLTSMSPGRSPEELVEELGRLSKALAPKLPHMDPGDLLLILESLARPFGSGRRIFPMASVRG